MHPILLFFVFLLISSCTSSVSSPPPAAPKISQHRLMPSFNRVMVEGIINVSLHTGYSQPQVILSGDLRDLMQAHTFVQNGTLMVQLGKGYPHFGPVSAEIRAPSLSFFSYRGYGLITGNQLHTSALTLSINNPGRTILSGSLGLTRLEVQGRGYTRINGITSRYLQLALSDQAKVELMGVINLSVIDLSGVGQVNVFWVKSKQLTVRGRERALIQLAGTVDKLDLELWDAARFKGRYLRANRAFIKTHDRSIAEISAIDRQHSLATDVSDIYFYHIPEMRTDFMTCNGAVLDMRDWNQPNLAEYDRYNK